MHFDIKIITKHTNFESSPTALWLPSPLYCQSMDICHILAYKTWFQGQNQSWHIRHDFKDKINYKKEEKKKKKVMIVILCTYDIAEIVFSQL